MWGQAESWALPWLKGWCHRPSCCCCLVYCGQRCHLTRRLGLYELPLLRLLRSLELWAQPGPWDCRHFLTALSCHHLHVFLVHFIQWYRCMEFSGNRVCCTEATLLSYGYFTGCRLKEKDKATYAAVMPAPSYHFTFVFNCNTCTILIC